MTGLEAIALHGLGDFILQTDYIAARKLSDWKVRVLHVTLYCLPYAMLLAWLGEHWGWFVFWLALSHFVIDSRRWCESKWAPRVIIVDQVLHLSVLAVLMRVLA